jgi:hypothetical protein
MKRIAIVAVLVTAFIAVALPAGAVVDEQVGAWCGKPANTAPNGGLSPPGISDMTKSNFAKPVSVNGVVVPNGGPINLKIGDSPAAKFKAGTDLFISAADLDHPLTHCKKLR